MTNYTTYVCDCGNRIRTSGKRTICDRCWMLDGRTDIEQDVISELRDGIYSVAEIVSNTGIHKGSVLKVVRRLQREKRVIEVEGPANAGYFRLGHPWDTTSAEVAWPKVPRVVFPHLEQTAVEHAGWLEAEGRVISGPIGPAKYPGRRFKDKDTARKFYGRRYEIVTELGLPVPRYFFRVKAKQKEKHVNA